MKKGAYSGKIRRRRENLERDTFNGRLIIGPDAFAKAKDMVANDSTVVLIGASSKKPPGWRLIAEGYERMTFEGQTVVVNDALSVVSGLRKGDPTNAVAALGALKSARRLLLVTPCVVEKDEADFAFLANMAAGFDCLPYRPSEIHSQHDSINYLVSAVDGWLLPVQKTALYQLIYKVIPGFKANFKDAAEFQNMILNLAEKTNTTVDAPRSETPKGLKQFILRSTMPLTNSFAGTEHADIAAQVNEWLDGKSNASPQMKMELSKTIHKLMVYANDLDVRARWTLIMFVYMLLYSIAQMWIPRPKIRKLSATSMASAVPKGLITWTTAESALVTRVVPYSQEQMELWIRYTFGKLNENELVRLGAFRDVQEAKMLGDRAYEMSQYHKIGISIGNMGHSPPKFAAIEREIQAAARSGDKIVVASAFKENGVDLLRPWVVGKGVTLVVIDGNPNDYQAVCDVMILMEPVGKATLERLRSAYDPRKIVQICCSIRQPKIWLLTAMYTIRMWLKFSPEVFYTKRYTIFSQSETPDELVLEKQRELDEMENDIRRQF